MTWGRLDDDFHSHPKRFLSGLAGDGLLARGISYAANHLTDGFLPEAWVYAQVPGTRRNRDMEGIVSALVTARVLEVVPNGDRFEVAPDGVYVGPGFLIHHFLDSNLSRQEAYDLAEKKSQAGRRGAAARWGKRNGNSKAPAMADGKASAIAEAMPKNAPDPSPRPDPKQKASSSEEARARALEETPKALHPFIAPVGHALRRVAAEKAGAGEPTVPAVCKALRDFPNRDFVPAAQAFEHYYLHGNGAKRAMKDVVRTYRNWIEKEPDVLRKTQPGNGGGRSTVDRTDRNLAEARGEA